MATDKDAKEGGRCGCRATFNVVIALVTRLGLFVHAGLATWVCVTVTGNDKYYILLAAASLLGVETLFTLIKRGGKEGKWVCWCFIAYLCVALPPIWLIELKRYENYNSALSDSANLTSLVAVNGLTVPIKLSSDVWVSIIEQTLLFNLVFCRWMLPRGNLTRHELSQLLFVFMGIASDNMELFELFDEPEVRTDEILTYVILGVWSLSLVQFVFVLTATKNSKELRADPSTADGDSENPGGSQPKRRPGLCEILFTTETWSLLISTMVQDGPYAAVRIFCLVKYKLVTYTVIFFVCKNILFILIVFYRLVVLCVEKCSIDDDEDNDVVKITVNGGNKGKSSTGPASPRVGPAGDLPAVDG